MKHKKSLSALIAVIIAFVSLTPGLKAQNTNNNASGLSISPTRTELRIDPGGSDVVNISLRNVTAGPVQAIAFINDFESDDVSGEPAIQVNNDEPGPNSIKPFLKDVANATLQPGESKAFDIKVEIPQSAAPGAYYGVIRYASVPLGEAAPEPGQVALTASVASIVLIEVAGNIREQVELKSVNALRADRAGGFFIAKPDQVGIELVNKGNGFARPFGTVTITNPLRHQVHSYELNDSTPRSNILPDSNRIFKDPLKGVSWPGIYQITASVSFGSSGGEILVMKKSFWYLPVWFIVSLLILVGAIVVLVQRMRHHLRRARRRH